MKARKFVACVWVLGAAALVPAMRAGGQDQDSDKKTAPPPRETIAKPLTEKQIKRQKEKLRKELETPYRKWLTEDVTYIITDEERQAFKRLQTDEERDQFIEQFWLRRDPTPDTIENEFKEEHYRRIAYANEHFASGIPGWKTDRGRFYIMYGPADEIESHPAGGTYERPIDEGGGETSTYPFEQWRYRYIEGIGTNVVLEFVDPSNSGEYHFTIDPSEKDALLYVPGAGLTMSEQMGLSSKDDRFMRTDGTHLGTGPSMDLPESLNEFTRLERGSKLFRPPAIKFKDLEAAVDTRITYNILPVQVKVDFMRMTDSTVLTSVAIQLDNKDLQFQDKGGVSKASVNMYGRITSMGRRPVSVWEEPVTIEVPTQMLGATNKHSSVYGHSVFLAPGTYRLNVVVKDVVAATMNNYEVALRVPHFDDAKLASSTVILADLLESLPTRSIGAGQFVIGDSKVRPRVTDTFHRDEKMGIYFQLYNFAPDDKTQKPNGQIQYQIVKNGSNQKLVDWTENLSDAKAYPGASAQQVTVEKLLPLARYEPGQYTLKMTVTDKNRNEVLTPSATFTVN
ncbi:MAG TPA: GWxTD domain-containing protein [Bryobacteraceae bacterium]|nr:GWxTD domain-containing protein [Bryobacteraceae bacterium]